VLVKSLRERRTALYGVPESSYRITGQNPGVSQASDVVLPEATQAILEVTLLAGLNERVFSQVQDLVRAQTADRGAKDGVSDCAQGVNIARWRVQGMPLGNQRKETVSLSN
jgi:hypothetical protein